MNIFVARVFLIHVQHCALWLKRGIRETGSTVIIKTYDIINANIQIYFMEQIFYLRDKKELNMHV